MGCQCCRMIKSYIYDPSVTVDGRKSDSAGSSLYQPHRFPPGGPGGDPALGGHDRHKQGINNLGYSKSSDSTLKLEVDNNHVNQRLHAAPSARELQRPVGGGAPPPEVYIIQPQALGPRWTLQEHVPSQVPVYPDIEGYQGQGSYAERGYRASRDGWDGSITECGVESQSADEADEGVGGTPEYLCDTGDEGSVLSVDIHTSTTSLSSADTKDELRLAKTPDVSTVESGISGMKSEDEEERRKEVEEDEEEEEEEVQSITDSMVAEALAALEAATAGEEEDE